MNGLTKAAVQGAACGLMIGAVLLAGWRVWHPATVGAPAHGVADVVRSRSFEVVDAAGKARASLSMLFDLKGPGLTLRDAAGTKRADLYLMDGYPSLNLYDAAGVSRANLDPSSLTLRDAAAKLRASLDMRPDGTPGLYMYDTTLKALARLEILPDGTPALGLCDATGNWRALLKMFPDGGPGLDLYDAAGKLRAALGATTLTIVKTGEETKRAESSLVLFDKDGKVFRQIP